MNPTANPQEMFAPLQHLWADGMAMAMEAMEASHESGRKVMETAFSFAAAQAKDQVKYASELAGHLTAAGGQANAMLREQASLATELPKDPAGMAQRMLAGYLDAWKQSMAVGAEALRTSSSIVGQAWGNLEKVSQESRDIYNQYTGKLQGIVEARVKKS